MLEGSCDAPRQLFNKHDGWCALTCTVLESFRAALDRQLRDALHVCVEAEVCGGGKEVGSCVNNTVCRQAGRQASSDMQCAVCGCGDVYIQGGKSTLSIIFFAPSF